MALKKGNIINKNLNFADLFAGIGGFHQALSEFGKCVLASEIDSDCVKIYKNNYKIDPKGDISKINEEDIPDFNILAAGFNCQPFSKAGHQKGFKDERGQLFFEICRIAKHKKPKYMILENVRNLKTHDEGKTWQTIKNKIREIGYNTYDDPLILNTLYFKIPQFRERVIILCKRKDIGDLPTLPDIDKNNIQSTSLESIIDTDPDEIKKYKITGKLKTVEIVWDEFLEILYNNNIDVPKFPIWTDWWDSDGKNTNVTKPDKNKTEEENIKFIKKKQKDFYNKYTNWIDKNRDFYNNNKNILQPWLEKSRKIDNWTGSVRKFEWQVGNDKLRMNQVLWSPRGSGIRVKKIDYAPTLVAMASMLPIYGPLSKQLSPKECSRLQSFSPNTIIHEKDKIAYKQFGNAVNVTMINKCAKFLINNEPLF